MSQVLGEVSKVILLVLEHTELTSAHTSLILMKMHIIRGLNTQCDLGHIRPTGLEFDTL